MADDVTFQSTTLATPPSGTVVSTDDVGGKQVQRMKLMDGTDAGSSMAKVSSEGNLQTITPNRTASGTLNALNDAVTLDASGIGTIAWEVRVPSAFSGTLVAEGTFDNTNWVTILSTYWTADPEFGSIAPPDQAWIADAGYSQVRLRCDAYTSGSCTAVLVGSPVHSSNSGTAQRVAGSYPGGTFVTDSFPNPVLVGAKASSAALTPGDGNSTHLRADLNGALVVSEGGGSLTVDGTVTANLAAGTNNIGDIDVLTLPADPLGANADASVAAGATGSISAKLRRATQGLEDLKTGISLAAGSAAIGKLAANSGVDIGDVDVTSVGGNVTVVQGTGTNLHAVVDSGSITADTELTTADLDTGAGTDTRAVVGLVGSKSGGGALIPGDATAGLKVDLGADNDVTVTSGSITATQATGTNLHTVVDSGTITTVSAVTAISNALPAGTNNIGDVDVLTVPADPFGANADAASATGSISAKLRFIAATGIPVTSVPSHAVTNAGTFATQVDGAALTSLQLLDDTVFADEASFTVATSKVSTVGLHAVVSGSAPDSTGSDTAVNPITNRNRVPFVIGGDPGVITLKHTNITTAVTDAAIVTISTGNKIVVTRLTVTLDNASTVFPTCVIGFGTANTPTTTGVLFAHGGVPAGGGATIGDGSGILGVGADNEDLRVTTTGNATGNGLQITVSYYLIVA